MEYAQIVDLAALLRVLTHPVRLDVVFILAELEELSVSMLQYETEVSKQVMTNHLALLEEAGVITARRQGRMKYISLKRKDLPEILKELAGITAK